MKKRKINARDTSNFVVRELENFPEAVGVNDVYVKKGESPHYANVYENSDRTIPFPNVNKYMVEGKTSE